MNSSLKTEQFYNDVAAEVAATNMATTASDYILGKVLPERFTKGDDVEEFIKECELFFKISQTKQKDQNLLIVALLDRETKDLFLGVDPNIVDYKDWEQLSEMKRQLLKI